MARKTEVVTITDEGRDQGKAFLLTEMSASAAEKWAFRALSALARSGVDIPENVTGLGFAGIAHLGLQAFAGLNFGDAEPLLDEMMACVQTMPDPFKPAIVRRLIEDDIDEVRTRFTLRGRVLALHADFSKAAALLKREDSTTADPTLNTQTSPA